MAVFNHYLMATLGSGSPLPQRYGFRYLIYCATGAVRTTKFCSNFPGALEGRIALVFDHGIEPHSTQGSYVVQQRYGVDQVDAAVKRIFDHMEISGWNPDQVALDMTCMPVEYALLLVKGLRERCGAQRTLVAYTEAGGYVANKFTHGLREVNAIPGFIGSPDVDKSELLAVILGFEGERSMALYSKIDPETVVAINGFPALKPGWETRSLNANLDLISNLRPNESFFNCPANNPFELVNVLEDIYQDNFGRYNFSVAPLGASPHALGAALFAIRRPECKLVYHYPVSIVSGSSDGSGETWVYLVTYDDLVAGK